VGEGGGQTGGRKVLEAGGRCEMSSRSTPRSSAGGGKVGLVSRDDVLDRAIASGRREAMYERSDALMECRALRAEVATLRARESRMDKEVAHLQRFLAQKVQDRAAVHSKYIPTHMPKGIKGSDMDEADAYVGVVARLQSETSSLRQQVKDGEEAAAWLRLELVKTERAGKEREIALRHEMKLLTDALKEATTRAQESSSPPPSALAARSPRRKMRRDVVNEQRQLLQKLRLEQDLESDPAAHGDSDATGAQKQEAVETMGTGEEGSAQQEAAEPGGTNAAAADEGQPAEEAIAEA